MYRQELGMGDRLSLYFCQEYALQDWTGRGSYYNLQTCGTRALLKDQNRTVIDITLWPSRRGSPCRSWDGWPRTGRLARRG